MRPSWQLIGLLFVAACTTPPEPRGWLGDLFHRVPDDTLAVAVARMPAHTLLEAILHGLGPDVRDVADEALRHTDAFVNCSELGKELSLEVEPRFALVMRPHRSDPRVRVARPEPRPDWALVFWLRQQGRDPTAARLETLLTKHHQTFAFRSVWTEDVRGVRVVEFAQPRLPASGKIALARTANLFAIGSSGTLLAAIAQPEEDTQRAFRAAFRGSHSQPLDRFNTHELDEGHGALWFRPVLLQQVLEDYRPWTAKRREELMDHVDPDWSTVVREESANAVFAEHYAGRFRTKDEIPGTEREEFDSRVAAHTLRRWREDTAARDEVVEAPAMREIRTLLRISPSQPGCVGFTEVAMREWLVQWFGG